MNIAIPLVSSSRRSALDRYLKSRIMRNEALTGFAFLSPWIIGFLAFTLIPMILTLLMTFTNFRLVQAEPLRFVGLNNYIKLLNDPQMRQALDVTIRFGLFSLPLSILLPVGLAALINTKSLWGRGLFYTLFYMPTIVPLVSTAFIWSGVLNPQGGWVNTLLVSMGVQNMGRDGHNAYAAAVTSQQSDPSADGRRVTYLYFDEAGNFDFSPNGTRVFMMTCVVLRRPFAMHAPLLDIKYGLLEAGLNIEYFHAAEDKQRVRDEVFETVAASLDSVEAYSVIVQKRRVDPSDRAPHTIYREAFSRLVEKACPPACLTADHVIAITDQLPLNKKRAAFEKALKPYLKKHLGQAASYDLFHHQSRSDLNLQVADYISWAVYRKWNRGDSRSYGLIASCMRSEVECLSDGPEHY